MFGIEEPGLIEKKKQPFLAKSNVRFISVILTLTLLNPYASVREGITQTGLPAPSISGPSSSTMNYTISWSSQVELFEYAKLEEWTSYTGWKDPMKISENSKTFHNKLDGTYKYRVKICEWDSELRTEYCTPYSAVHTIIVGVPGKPYQVLDGGRTIVSPYSMFTTNGPDLDKDGLADNWENNIASLSMPQVRLDEKEDLLDHPEHHIFDFVRVVPLVPIVKQTSKVGTSPKTTNATNKLKRQPNITGPTSSTGTYTINWDPQYPSEYAKLYEHTCHSIIGRSQKVHGNSKTYHNKPDGIYRYTVQICEWISESREEFCTPHSVVHSVTVDNPEHIGYLLVIHAFSWSRDYGRYGFRGHLAWRDHNGDVERVAMLWKINNDKQIRLEHVYMAAHEGTSVDHSGVYRACEGCMSCIYGKVIEGTDQRLCIESLQFTSNRLRVRASEDKHAIYPRKKLCEEVVLVAPNFGENCGDGPLYGTKQIKVFNVGEPWSDGQLINHLNDHQVLRRIFPNEAIWSASKFCGGLGFEDNCPGSIGSKLVAASELLQFSGVCETPGSLVYNETDDLNWLVPVISRILGR